jgi:hypothetical protein
MRHAPTLRCPVSHSFRGALYFVARVKNNLALSVFFTRFEEENKMAETPQVPPPGYLANALANVQPSPRAVEFAPLHGAYVTKHDNGKPVRIMRGSFTRECVGFLLFKTTLNTDFDGARDSYAPPVGINQPSGPHNNPGLNGLQPRDWIFNATDKRFPPEQFHANGNNHFEWTGVVSAVAGANIDNRLFLRDHEVKTGLRRFPVIQRNGPFAGFYEPQTAMQMIDGNVRRAVKRRPNDPRRRVGQAKGLALPTEPLSRRPRQQPISACGTRVRVETRTICFR